MTALAQRSLRSGPAALGGPALPQVNLLPPEVRAARGLTGTKRILGIVLLGVILFAGVGYAAALAVSSSATSDLVEAQEETVRLQLEEAKYAEVPLVVNSLKRTTVARTLGMSTEIQWKSYLDAISAVLPPGVSIDTLTMTQASPSIAAPAPADELSVQGIASISFTGRASTLPDSAAWIVALNSVPTFHGATFTSVAIEERDGVAGFTLASTVLVDSGALSGRFTDLTEGN